jgi:hypothetical protein
MKTKKLRGIALIMVLSIAGVLMLMLSLIAHQTIQQMHFAGSKDWQDKAYLAAYSGIQLATATLEEQPYFGSDGYDPPSVTGQPNLAHGELQPTSFMFDPNYHFLTRVCNNSAGTETLMAWDEFMVPAGKIYVRSDGAYSEKANDGCISLRALLETAQPIFNHAVLGDASISLSGTSKVDSFKPSLPGQYGTNFAVATNQKTGVPVTIGNGSECKGGILVGAGTGASVVDDLISEQASNTDKTRYGQLSALQKMPSYSIPAGFNSNQAFSTQTGTIAPTSPGALTSFNNLVLPSGSSATIKPGTYFVNDKVEISGTLTVDLTGVPNPVGSVPTSQEQDNRTVFLYVKNKFALTGGSIVLPAALSARNFQVMMIGDEVSGDHVSEFKVEGAAGSPIDVTLTASGWGMQASVKNAVVNGAIQGSTVSLENATLHYDETLKNTKLGKVQQSAITGEVFNLVVTSNPALKTKIYASQLGNTFTQVQTVNVGEPVAAP